jgi:hypothetical protein
MTNYARAFSIGVDEFIVIIPYNGTHREIILLHVHEPIKFHDPIITFKVFIFSSSLDSISFGICRGTTNM